MRHEISELDIKDRQLLTNNAQSRTGMGTDIGEAKITHTIFGKAKVRIIRKQDKVRRVWAYSSLLVIALSFAAWQGWVASLQTEPIPGATLPSPVSAMEQVSVPTLLPEYTSHPANPASIMRSKPGASSPIEINNPTAKPKSTPQQLPGLKGAGQIPVKPIAAQPLMAIKPQSSPLAATNVNVSKNPTDKPLPIKPSIPNQSAAPAVAAVHAPHPSVPLAASSPTAAAPIVAPSIKEGAAQQSPAGDKQATEPVNAQIK